MDCFLIEGSVGFHNVLSLRYQIEESILAFSQSSKKTPFFVDFLNMNGDDASSLALLLCIIRYAKSKQCEIELKNVPLSIERMKELFGLKELLLSVRNEV